MDAEARLENGVEHLVLEASTDPERSPVTCMVCSKMLYYTVLLLRVARKGKRFDSKFTLQKTRIPEGALILAQTDGLG
jgi:hypothetical protein